MSDIGSVNDNLNEAFKKSYGPGVVWLSPIGAAELYVARPLDRGRGRWIIVFNLGPDL